jgi:hypothetical protein
MSRRALLPVVGLVCVALVSALVVVAVAWQGRGATEEGLESLPTATSVPSEPSAQPPIAPPDDDTPIRSRGMLTPQIILFGDVIEARLDVVLDNTRIDPGSVRISAGFTPWEVLGDPERTRRDVGSTTYLRTTWRLRCFIGPCVPSGQVAPLEFSQARVTFVVPAEGVERQAMPAPWPVLTVFSRFASASFDDDFAAPPWRADVLTLPAVTYRVPPNLALGVLVGAGGLLVLGGFALLFVARPRRAPAPEPEPVVVLPPRLTPLQQALALLEDMNNANGAEDRRRSLELVADALSDWGDPNLSRTARVLAWSEHAPVPEETSDLAARVRETLRAELEALEALEAEEQMGNGRVV